MSAPQASAKANSRNKSFSALINDGLVSSGHDVLWADPNIDFTKEMADQFDSVLVGISPITSLGANRVYGALGVIDTLLKHAPKKLSLLIDAPNVSQIKVSLNAVLAASEGLVKPFYSYRKDYLKVKNSPELQAKLLSVIKHLLENEWPVTIYPSLPWKQDSTVADKLPSGASNRLVGLNLDSLVLIEPTDSSERAAKWVVDEPSAKWTKTTSATLVNPCLPMKLTKGSTDADIEFQISRSMGALITPDKKQETWWSYRYIQALNTTTPIASNWYETQELGAAWAMLAATIESCSEDKRRLIAIAQRESYSHSIPDRIESIKKLHSVLRIK